MLDSGVGGLSIVRAFQAFAPSERIVYFADTAWFPYGGRPAPEVRKRVFAITQRLLEADCKLIALACNTASAAALADLRQAFDVPFVGVVPGVKPGAAAGKDVVILATPGTLSGDLYARVTEEFGHGVHITEVPGHGLADLVERGKGGTPAAREALREHLAGPVARGAGTVVLGCTHYNFLADDIRAEFPGLAIVDTSESVARRILQVLRESGLEAPPGAASELDLIVSGDRAAFRESMTRLGFSPTHSPAGANG
jgi:glutamate racemase